MYELYQKKEKGTPTKNITKREKNQNATFIYSIFQKNYNSKLLDFMLSSLTESLNDVIKMIQLSLYDVHVI